MNHYSDAWPMRRYSSDAVAPLSSDQQVVAELIKVLSPHPGGLRRWSVMRAIRAERTRTSRPVSLKFEAEVERVFKAACGSHADGSLFYKPEGKAGEVWAVRAERVDAGQQPETAHGAGL
jgi:hypothetical protein